MQSSISFNKVTRKGKVLKIMREHYLRDDIPCGSPVCSFCTAAEEDSSLVSGLPMLSDEPAGGRYLIIDTNVAGPQLDFLENSSKFCNDVIILQTVLEAVKAQSVAKYARLQALIRDRRRRFVHFPNLHHRETFVERQPGESSAAYEERCIRVAALWFQQHWEDTGLSVALISDREEVLTAARDEGLEHALTTRQLLGSYGTEAAELAEMLASISAAAAGGAGGAGAGAASGGRQRFYPEHWSSARVASSLKSRTAFQGTLRVNRDCWFEARVAIHGILGHSGAESKAMTGGDDVVSVLILGRENMNRAMEGDTVIVQLLPVEQWRHPSKRLAVEAESAEQEAEEEKRALTAAAALQGKEKEELEGSGKAAAGAGEEGAAAAGGAAGGAPAAATTTAAPATGAAAEDAEARRSLAALRALLRKNAAKNLQEQQERKSAAGRAAARQKQREQQAAGGLELGPVPTARVVAVVRRHWRQYCASLEVTPELLPGDSAVVVAAAAAEGKAGKAADSTASTAAAAAAAAADGKSKKKGKGKAAADAPTSSSSSAVAPSTDDDGGEFAERVLAVPVDPRVPRIELETRQRSSLQDKRIIVAVDAWDAFSRYPRGHYVRTIGLIGDRKAETEVILHEHEIPFAAFTPEVIACLPNADWRITAENSKGRVDLRSLPICSIDPPGCKDIDDALHARWLANGNLEIGVHIADVGYFVKEGTAIDLEAAMRANTTYLVEKRLDMLPGLLTETLCSLKGGQERFAFSVTWQYRPVRPAGLAGGAAAGGAAAGGAAGSLITEEERRVWAAVDSIPMGGSPPVLHSTGAAGSCILGRDQWEEVPGQRRYFKSIIRSRAAMTYAAAQALLDDPSAEDEIAQGVKLLASVARSLKNSRKEAGALSLASAEVKVQLDSETHEPIDVQAYVLRETNSTVEEFMLLANVAVAQRIVQAFPRYSMLRRHPAPPQSQFAPLVAAAEAVGVQLRTGSSRELADSLDTAEVAGNPHINRLLRILATRSMMQATYFCSGDYEPLEHVHYGLAAPCYTHFTSPIRRYADVIVHRLLSAALELEPLPRKYEDRLSMKRLSDNMNKRHLMSQLAGRASAALHTHIFFANRTVLETGLVIRVKGNGMVLLLPRFGLETSVILGKEEGELMQLLGLSAGGKKSTGAAAAGGAGAEAGAEAGAAAGTAKDQQQQQQQQQQEARAAMLAGLQTLAKLEDSGSGSSGSAAAAGGAAGKETSTSSGSSSGSALSSLLSGLDRRLEAYALQYNEEQQTLVATARLPGCGPASPSSSSSSSLSLASPITLRIFDEVKVCLRVEERAGHRKQLIYRLVQPSLHSLRDRQGEGLPIVVDGEEQKDDGALTGAAAGGAGAGASSKQDGKEGKKLLQNVGAMLISGKKRQREAAAARGAAAAAGGAGAAAASEESAAVSSSAAALLSPASTAAAESKGKKKAR